jgi:hypothetical protein
MAGHGWRMLMECLATGRAISLPAIGSVSIKHALRVTSAYARIRRQFGIPIGQMEGVAEPLSRLVTSAYQYEAARGLTATMVDQGQRPAVLSALLKYRTTEAMRLAINDAMDIHGGRAVQDGPSNYLFAAYATTPVAITVEGANILTRSLITFAQGALRAHPWLYAEIAAANEPDVRKGRVAFDRAFCGHASFMLANMAGSVFHAATIGGATALGRPDLGRLHVGAAADIVLVDLAHPLMTPPRDPLRALVFHAADRAVQRVMVGGETIYANGKPTKLNVADAAGILAESQARMLRDSVGRDYRGRSGDEITPISLPIH